ncbi:MAG2-interacting protein 2-like [Malus domestica]|uniref:MAG2-interacting protein 2-like n=1 Tax=Malus domestica TaxID=3750 RepID=UPI00397489AC
MLDAVSGVEVIEEQLRTRKDYQEVSSIMNVRMTYSLLYSSTFKCEDSTQMKELLLRKFKEKHTGEIGKFDKVQSTFWREWKLKLENQKRVADRCTTLEKIIPGVDTVYLCYLSSVLVSEVWTNDDITCEISKFKGEIIGYAVETIKAVSYIVYLAIDGCHKVRLAYIFGLLSCLHLWSAFGEIRFSHRSRVINGSFDAASCYMCRHQLAC